MIRDGSDPSQWNYVQTKMNPADDASRGVPVKDLIDNSMWINGPPFLWQSNETWPTRCTEDFKIYDDDAELKKSIQSHSVGWKRLFMDQVEKGCCMDVKI